MKTVLQLKLEEAIKRLSGSSVFYVLPKVAELQDPDDTKSVKAHFVFTTFIDGALYLIEDGFDHVKSKVFFYVDDQKVEKLCTEDFFRPGMKILLNKENELMTKYVVNYQISTSPESWRRCSNYPLYEGILCYGQSILVTAPPASGKSYTTRAILDSMEEYSNLPHIYRVLFGERKSDWLGDNTVNCDSSALVEYQLYILYQEFTKALRDGYSGHDAIIGIDSLTRMVTFLTTQYAHSHMVSGGISSSAMTMVNRLFDMSGKVGEGTLTIVGTCLWARPNNTWKNIYSELSAIATAEFLPAAKSGKLNKSRITETTERENVVRFLWMDWHY